MTRRQRIHTAAAAAVVLLALPAARPLVAQGLGQVVDSVLVATPEQVGERAATVMAQLAASYTEIETYRARLAEASAEDSLVLRLQLETSRDRFAESMQDFADIVGAAEQDTADVELRSRAVVVFNAVAPVTWGLIEELRAEIDDVRARRPGTPAAERSTLEDEITLLTGRVDRYYRYGEDLIQHLTDTGQDVVGVREQYSSLLAARGDELSGRIDLALWRIGGLDARLRDTPDDADARLLMAATRRNLEVNATSQSTVLDLMEGMGMPTGDYRAQLVTATQDFSSGLLDARVAAALARRAWKNVTSWVSNSGPGLLVNLLAVGIILLVGRFLAVWGRRIVKRSFDKARLDMSRLLRRMIANMTHHAIILLAVLVALSQLGISLGPMVAGLGVVGFIIGFAMQDSLSNLAAGMMILVNRPYDQGDLVEISGVLGTVEHMSMVSTTLLTIDNQRLEVPNNKVWGDVIKNVTDQRLRRVDMVFGISYGDDISHAERVLNEILADHELVLDDPEPMVRVNALGESSVDFVVRPWVKTDDYWDVHWDVTKTVKMRFDEEGISIPFPQRDVHVHEAKPGTA